MFLKNTNSFIFYLLLLHSGECVWLKDVVTPQTSLQVYFRKHDKIRGEDSVGAVTDSYCKNTPLLRLPVRSSQWLF